MKLYNQIDYHKEVCLTYYSTVARNYLRQIEQFCSSEPSPHPSRPEHTMAEDLQRPFAHLNGQYLFPLPVGPGNSFEKKLVTSSDPQRCGGSSEPSLQDMIALQNSYSGRHSPLRHGNVFSGHLRDLLKSHPISSSPLGH